MLKRRFKYEKIDRVRILKIYYTYKDVTMLFEIRKFKKNLYKIASYGANKNIEELFVPFTQVKKFFEFMKAERNFYL
mgnify:CR=1 FL=1